MKGYLKKWNFEVF